VNLKTINIHSLMKIPVLLLGLLLLVVIAVIVLVYSNYSKKTIESAGDNPESVIPPVETQEKQNKEVQLQSISIKNAIYVEDLVYNWQNILDIFTYNVNDSAFSSQDSALHSQVITKILTNPNRKFSKGASDEILAQYGDVLLEECKYYKLDWRLILAMMKQESAFVPDAVSHAGAYGFMQIMPKTGSMLERQLQLEEHRSPKNNLIAGIYYYASLVGRYYGAGDTNRYKFALAAYNAGSGHVEDAMSIAYYFHDNYFDWDVVKEYMPYLAPGNDSLHIKIWGHNPPAGVFANWKEPYHYVDSIIYFWQQYKKLYPLPEDNQRSGKKKKNKK
jgi:hypothetical protein